MKIAHLYVEFLRMQQRIRSLHERARKEAATSKSPALYYSPKELEENAGHEAGHAVLGAILTPECIIDVRIHTAVGEGDEWEKETCGYLRAECRHAVNADHLLSLMAIEYGGVVAEEKFLGGHTSRCIPDIRSVTAMAWKHLSFFAIIDGAPPIDYASFVTGMDDDSALTQALVRSLHQAHQRAKQTLEQHWQAWERVRNGLLQEHRLDRIALLRLCGTS